MNHCSTTCIGFLTRVRWSFAFLLMCMGMTMPPHAFSALTPRLAPIQTDLSLMSILQPSIKTWPAFESAQARSVCVRVTNGGTQNMTVWLLDSQSVVGLFTVLPQHISAMCTVANKIELGCSGDSCDSTWTVFDAP